MAAAPSMQVLQGARQAAVMLHPVRLRLLQALAEPNSAAGLARSIRLPRQQINYHLNKLKKAGLVEPVEKRRKGNCIERIVRATARSYLISPAALGGLAADPATVEDRFSATYLVALAARVIRELAVLQERAEKAQQRLPTLSVNVDVRFASAADRSAFAEELANDVARLAAKYHDDQAAGGRLFRVLLGAYPAITKNEDGTPLASAEG